MYLLFLVNFIWLTFSQYSVFIDTICKSYSENGNCNHWQQTSSITYTSNGACFPGHVLVLREDGERVPIQNLAVGDRILGRNPSTGQNEYTDVIAWLHKDLSINVTYKGIQTESDILWVSSEHNVAVLNNEQQIEYKIASEVELGNTLASEKNEKVQNIHEKVFTGAFAPYTRLANFYIGTTDATYLVHSFANIRNPTIYEYPFAFLMWMSQFFSFFQKEESESEYHLVTGYLKNLVLNNPRRSIEKRFSMSFALEEDFIPIQSLAPLHIILEDIETRNSDDD